MKKLFIYLMITAALLFPVVAHAEVKVDGFKDTVDYEISIYGENENYAEEVEKLKNAKISETPAENAVNVYIFRGATCSHCLEAVAYFASISEEYGKYFDLKTYEVWYNEDNANLMKRVARKLGVSDVGGVPFIVIGNKKFEGFSETMAEDMVATIMDEYEKEERYDVIEKLDENNSTLVVLASTCIFAVFVGGLAVAKNKNK